MYVSVFVIVLLGEHPLVPECSPCRCLLGIGPSEVANAQNRANREERSNQMQQQREHKEVPQADPQQMLPETMRIARAPPRFFSTASGSTCLTM